jgi:hypothetical protein
MSMLDRIKKRYQDGFKEFVLSLEASSSKVRGQIFLTGLLEDPVFMGHVVKNIKSFDDIISMGPEDLGVIISEDRQLIGVLATCLSNSQTKIQSFEQRHPVLAPLVKEELSLMKSASPSEIEQAQQFFIKLTRKFQTQGKIKGFDWFLPPQEVYVSRRVSDGPVKIEFENGATAALGFHVKGKREGMWYHYYETGALLAVGNYSKGLKEGEWKFFYSSGKLKGVGEFRSDVRDGLWIDWDRSGKHTESTYENGTKKKD